MAKLAFIFPGQGSQSVGMLANLASDYPIIEQTFQQASQVLGYDLWEIVSKGPETQLNKTEITQPALLTAGVALWRVWQDKQEIKPSYMAGHSLGEYSALVCAEVLAFEDAVAIVRERGRLMQDAVPEGKGAMAAILGLEDEIVEKVCQETEGVVEPVNYNSPGQVVIAGEKQAVEKAMELAKAQKAKKAILLAVSVPSHSSLMKPAAEKLAAFLENYTFNSPKIAIWHNVDASVHENTEAIKQALIAQLYNPVLWVKTMQNLQKQTVQTILECGPGKVLIGLAKRIDKSWQLLALSDPNDLEKGLLL